MKLACLFGNARISSWVRIFEHKFSDMVSCIRQDPYYDLKIMVAGMLVPIYLPESNATLAYAGVGLALGAYSLKRFMLRREGKLTRNSYPGIYTRGCEAGGA